MRRMEQKFAIDVEAFVFEDLSFCWPVAGKSILTAAIEVHESRDGRERV